MKADPPHNTHTHTFSLTSKLGQLQGLKPTNGCQPLVDHSGMGLPQMQTQTGHILNNDQLGTWLGPNTSI